MGLFNNFFGKKYKNLNKVKLSLIDYNQFFENKTFDNIPLELLDLGELNLSTGEVIACDPLVCLYDTLPFLRTVLPGKYPVTACIAKTENSGDRYAVVRLEFSKDRATKWEMALTENQDVNELKEEDEFFGFPVDAGLGCFCDIEAQQLYSQFETDFMQRNPNGNIYDDFFAAEFKKNAIDPNNPQDIGDWLNFHLPTSPDLNVIMFHSGYGDGMYPCYWGINDNGEICSLIVDFQVF
ncbi:MAG: DUF4241 domain-containing protein [Chitinophagaceae bacterium]